MGGWSAGWIVTAGLAAGAMRRDTASFSPFLTYSFFFCYFHLNYFIRFIRRSPFAITARPEASR
jgi:hypothetical protein